jgi:hypothetical protein
MDYSNTIKQARLIAIHFYKNAYKSNESHTNLIKIYLNWLHISDSNIIDFIREEMHIAINNYKYWILDNEYITKA